MQPHGGVRIGEDARDPRRGRAHLDTELLAQLACERRPRVLAGLDLAAGKLPIAGIALSLGALRQQEHAVGALDDSRGDRGQVT